MERFFWKIFRSLRKLFFGKYWTYLAGPLDLTKDKGIGWRRKYGPLLKEYLPLIIQDPTDERYSPVEKKTLQESHRLLYKIREKNEQEFFAIAWNKICKLSLGMVKKSDFIVVYWDLKMTTIGTIVEMAEALRLRIPIYFLTDGDTKKLATSNWLSTLIWLSGGKIFVNANREALFKQAFEYLHEKYGKKRN